jgi:hypothetical protein
MVRRGRPAIASNAPRLDRRGMSELLGCDLGVAGHAKVAGVVVHILTAKSEWYDVVDPRCDADDVTIEAAFA